MILPTIPPGHRNGRLTVIAFHRDPKDPKHPKYRCRCDCGQIVLVMRANLARTHSCGCLRVEQLVARSTTHAMSSTAEFHAWAGMIDRCSRPSRKDFAQYGGRGICVCRRWLDSFPAFYADMGPRPSLKHSIDRIDTNGNYEPANCRWATSQQQRVNQRRTQILTVDGVSGTLKALARHFGIHHHTVQSRIRQMGWALERAMKEPAHRKRSL